MPLNADLSVEGLLAAQDKHTQLRVADRSAAMMALFAQVRTYRKLLSFNRTEMMIHSCAVRQACQSTTCCCSPLAADENAQLFQSQDLNNGTKSQMDSCVMLH